MKYSKGKARERRTCLAEAEKNVKRYELICDNDPSQNNVNNVSSYEELLQRASLPTLYTRRLQDIAIMMFKSKTVWRPRISRTYSLSLVLIII